MDRTDRRLQGGKLKGHFVALPAELLRSEAFRVLSYTARCLLLDIALQFKGSNNGRLVACSKALKPLGWNSHSTIGKAINELLAVQLIYLTRQGKRPNTASWYALTWKVLDYEHGMECAQKPYDLNCYRAVEKLKPLTRKLANG